MRVRICQIDIAGAFDDLPTSERFSVSAYLRLALPAAFQAEYDRILYIDCDVFAVGSAIGDIFSVDLQGAALGAVSDNVKWKRPDDPTPDQKALGLTGNYFNSGILLIDCKRFVETDILGQCISIAQQYKEDDIYFDQTLLNIALQDKWAQLHPAWNWQWALVRPMFEIFLDVQFVHFVSVAKPWSDPRGGLPARYRGLARRFFQQHFPAIQPPAPKPKFQRRRFIAQLFKHIGKVPQITRLLQRYGDDILTVKAPRV